MDLFPSVKFKINRIQKVANNSYTKFSQTCYMNQAEKLPSLKLDGDAETVKTTW